MTDPAGTRPPLVSHVSVGVRDLTLAARFYDAALGALGARRVMEHGRGVAWGRAFPEFWASLPHDGKDASPGDGVHVCFTADNAEAVARFHSAGLAAGGFDEGPPGPRPHYAPGYYAAFLRDPDGNKVEALCWLPSETAAVEPGAAGA